MAFSRLSDAGEKWTKVSRLDEEQGFEANEHSGCLTG